MRGYLSEKFQTQRISNLGNITETVTGISVEEIGKLGLPIPGASLHYFQKKGVHWTTHLEEFYLSIQSDLKYSKFFKIRVSLTNPKSASFGTRTDTSNR